MKTILVMTLLLLPSAALGQNTDVTRLQSTCLPTAPLSTLRAVIQVESSGNPNAMQIDLDRKSTRLNSSHQIISYAVFCLKKKKKNRSNNYVTTYKTCRLTQTITRAD